MSGEDASTRLHTIITPALVDRASRDVEFDRSAALR
jgi:hypothetical protein